jgi:N-acetylglucosamine-6-sulfatase
MRAVATARVVEIHDGGKSRCQNADQCALVKCEAQKSFALHSRFSIHAFIWVGDSPRVRDAHVMRRLLLLVCVLCVVLSLILALPRVFADELALPEIPGAKKRNIIFILTDDQRYDALGFMHPFLETPNMDSLAKNGVHLKNAFVTTSLCSPSRASILTGLYAHKHHVVDNNNPIPKSTIFFPQYLQKAGYETAFIGKWHMGGDDSPEPGFDYWLSFREQGQYWNTPGGFNINGQRVPQKGYITDELTDYALDWLKSRSGDKPFFLYLSHKAVHEPVVPPERYKDRYKNKIFTPPATMADTPENYSDKPMWLKNQRNSWHGVDFAYYNKEGSVGDIYKRYCETLLAVDDNLGRVLNFLREKKLLDSTLIILMGDNGLQFGEHGIIDKRTAYEASMRVPMLMQCPELFKPGTVVDKMVANIDIAPTILEAAGLRPPDYMDGKSFVQLAEGKTVPWRDKLLYEYYWERNYPMTPTIHALRTNFTICKTIRMKRII